MILKILSGGQTGVDRAALDIAIRLGYQSGGWCPKGRKAEDGPISAIYPLCETPSDDYRERTDWNVRDSDATLILTHDKPIGGTAFTIECALARAKPLLLLDLSTTPDPQTVLDWVRENNIAILNVAGPRESEVVGIYQQAGAFLTEVLKGRN
ncbi:MAG: putative molybdenum carrier protein [Acidobacteriota bacterium]